MGGGDGGWGAGKGVGMGDSVESLYQALGVAGIFPIPAYPHGTYVANLPTDTEDLDLLRIFSPFGAIPPDGIKVMRADDGSCKGVAFVNFTQPYALAAACSALNGALLPNGQTLVVKAKGSS